MKKNVLIFGLISGLLITTMMVVSIGMCYRSGGNFSGNDVVGYAAMIVAFSFIFVGIKNYRDKYNHGAISFGKAFKIGALISLVASTMYVVAWLIDYYLFIPDFMDVYCTHVVNTTKADGATAAELASVTKKMDSMKEMYKNPLFVVLFTYIEVLPLGLLVSLISALILKRKPGNPAMAMG